MSSLSINTGISATFARQKSKETENGTSQKLEDMASGLSIDSESRDSSDISVSTEADSQLRGGSQEIQNLQKNLSMLQAARDGTRQVQQDLEGLRELAVQAVESEESDTNQDLQEEASQLLGAIEETVSETQFNGETLLDEESGGSESTVTVEIGEGSTETVSLGDLSPDITGLESIDLSTSSGADDALGTLNGALNQVATAEAEIDDVTEDIASNIDSGLIQRENEAAARSQIRDSDLAQESTQSAQSSILNQAETSAFAQANNLEGSSALQLLE
jgi:flagellin